jgi:WD40 repeat protein
MRTTFQGCTGSVKSVAFSPDGKTLVGGCTFTRWYDQRGRSRGEIQLWDVVTGRECVTLPGHTSWVSCVAFRPDGKTLASASLDQTIKLWDVATGQERATLKGHTGWVDSVAFSPDGKTLASADHDGVVRLWDVAFGEERAVLKGHTGPVYAVAFAPDGKTLASASGGADQTIKLWDPLTGQKR